MECPKCHYVRSNMDRTPDYECPNCGIVYAKFDPSMAVRQAHLKAKHGNSHSLSPIRTEGGRLWSNANRTSSTDKSPADESDIRAADTTIPGNVAVCKKCEEIGQIRNSMPGNGWVEAVLYLFYLAPGIIYSVWRRKGKKQVCAACGSDELVAAKTRFGQQIVAAQHPSLKVGPNKVEMAALAPTTGRLTIVSLLALAASLLVLGICLFVTGVIDARRGETKDLITVGILLLGLALGTGLLARNLSIFKSTPKPKPTIGLGLISWSTVYSELE